MKQKKLQKGTYGYIDAYRRRHLIISLAWLFVVAAIFIIGILIFKTKLNFATLRDAYYAAGGQGMDCLYCHAAVSYG